MRIASLLCGAFLLYLNKKVLYIRKYFYLYIMNIEEINQSFEEAFNKLNRTASRGSCKLMYLAGLADSAVEATDNGPEATRETKESIMTYLEKTYNCGK